MITKSGTLQATESHFLTENGNLHGLKAGVDLAEDTANDRAKYHQGSNNNNGDQNKNQSILNQSLASFF